MPASKETHDWIEGKTPFIDRSHVPTRYRVEEIPRKLSWLPAMEYYESLGLNLQERTDLKPYRGKFSFRRYIRELWYHHIYWRYSNHPRAWVFRSA